MISVWLIANYCIIMAQKQFLSGWQKEGLRLAAPSFDPQ
jgi:hypothetical protein